MRSGVLACGLGALWATALPAQVTSPEAERLMRAARDQGMTLTPEQAERLAQWQRQLAERLGALGMMGLGGPRPSAPATVGAAVEAGLSEERLGAVVEAARLAGSTVKLDVTDGARLIIDGRRHVDPEGDLGSVAADAERNSATFLVGRGEARTVKFAALSDLSAAIPVGRLVEAGAGGYVFEGRTGVRVAGDRFITLPDGVALWRDDALFLYRFGSPVASYALPDGFYPAERQRGDVGRTGVMLLRRDQRGEDPNARAMRAVKSLFAMAGAGKAASDFSLFDTRTGKVLPLTIENFGQDGSPSDPTGSHYSWGVQWMRLGERRFAIHRAVGMKRLLVTDLDSGKTALAFERGLGIASWSFTPDGRGSGRLVATWMFQDHVVDDLTRWFGAAPAIGAG